MSYPIRIHYLALLGRRAALLVATVSVLLIAEQARSQGREVVEVVTSAGAKLAETSENNLLGIIAISSMCLAAYFGWLDRSAIQVILQKITVMEGRIGRMKCAMKSEDER